MANQIKVRIKNKVDPDGSLKLLEGELAVINSNGKTMLKVGDGSKEVSALGFVEMPWDEVSAYINSQVAEVSARALDTYTRSETSSATQISVAIDNIRNMISSAMTSTYEYAQHEIGEIGE